ncbi:hypothetical protein [Novilysobacter avium]|uniref:GIY-YIG nuclease family protein n=1 Tax=Novilysobacter avium TaxID=2781023 RepID=A0A7S6ZU68_9GAMM|nr:hypothetical protein [Lysobacter avium]QOW21782.1 hypothetical protein INQ42_11205 [Lysobacter avium]
MIASALDAQYTPMIPNKIPEVGGSQWKYWLSTDPVLKSPLSHGRCSYADWLRGTTPLHQKGVYIWLYPLSPEIYRFVHVGIAEKGASTLAERTKAHIRNARHIDRIYEVNPDVNPPYGSLGKELREGLRFDELSGEVRAVLQASIEKLRILYLLPVSPAPAPIRRMEAVLASTAARMLGHQADQWQVTNSMDKIRDSELSGDHMNQVWGWLNTIVPMLPKGGPLRW